MKIYLEDDCLSVYGWGHEISKIPLYYYPFFLLSMMDYYWVDDRILDLLNLRVDGTTHRFSKKFIKDLIGSLSPDEISCINDGYINPYDYPEGTYRSLCYLIIEGQCWFRICHKCHKKILVTKHGYPLHNCHNRNDVYTVDSCFNKVYHDIIEFTKKSKTRKLFPFIKEVKLECVELDKEEKTYDDEEYMSFGNIGFDGFPIVRSDTKGKKYKVVGQFSDDPSINYIETENNPRFFGIPLYIIYKDAEVIHETNNDYVVGHVVVFLKDNIEYKKISDFIEMEI